MASRVTVKQYHDGSHGGLMVFLDGKPYLNKVVGSLHVAEQIATNLKADLKKNPASREIHVDIGSHNIKKNPSEKIVAKLVPKSDRVGSYSDVELFFPDRKIDRRANRGKIEVWNYIGGHSEADREYFADLVSAKTVAEKRLVDEVKKIYVNNYRENPIKKTAKKPCKSCAAKKTKLIAAKGSAIKHSPRSKTNIARAKKASPKSYPATKQFGVYIAHVKDRWNREALFYKQANAYQYAKALAKMYPEAYVKVENEGN